MYWLEDSMDISDRLRELNRRKMYWEAIRRDPTNHIQSFHCFFNINPYVFVGEQRQYQLSQPALLFFWLRGLGAFRFQARYSDEMVTVCS